MILDADPIEVGVKTVTERKLRSLANLPAAKQYTATMYEHGVR